MQGRRACGEQRGKDVGGTKKTERRRGGEEERQEEGRGGELTQHDIFENKIFSRRHLERRKGSRASTGSRA